MKCFRCGGTVQKIVTDLPFKTKSNSIVIIRSLPVLQCSTCREYEIEDEPMKYVETKLFSADNFAELEIVRYAV
jgi:YgiT-type zinc finger domain-containing protein